MPTKTPRLPPGCGQDLEEPILFNPYQEQFQAARRKRFCLACKTIGSMDEMGKFTCSKCGKVHLNNLTAPRVFDRFGLVAGRGGGKTLVGALAVREELMIPNAVVWALGPTYKILHDSTFPTLVRRLDPRWIKRWDPEHVEITLYNGAMVAFRSLEDPERARGPHGVSCGWFDEAAQSPERAYDVFLPTLLKSGGIIIATTTPFGYDWTYERIEKQAKVYKEKGFWFTSWWTEENPILAASPAAKRQLEIDKKTWDPALFAQEYRAERRNATGLVYDYKKIDALTLKNDDAIKAYIPEWPQIDGDRKLLVGLDSGVDHPFGATLIVVTEKGLVVVGEYLQRMRALSEHLPAILTRFNLRPALQQIRWAANKNEANLRLEFGLKSVPVTPAESKHEVGIQRVASWLHTGQLLFAYTCPKTIEQMSAYRYAANTSIDGQKKKEQVFKFNDELPDALRYAVMAWPELPKATDAVVPTRDLTRLDAQTRGEIERMALWTKQKDGSERDLEPVDDGYPARDFYNPGDDDEMDNLSGSVWN